MGSRDCRVSQGGLFHSHKVQYSKETQSLLNRLIEESRLSILQRQSLRESVKRGEPLPSPSARSQSAQRSGRSKGEVLVPPALPRRRSYQAIVKSGAYHRDPFDPPHNSNMKDREAEKEKLQSLMTYGKNASKETLEMKQNHKQQQKLEGDEADSENLFDHLVQEIKERLEFLQEMEELGQAKIYQTVIEQEIAAKMRQMAKIDQQKFLSMGMNFEKINLAMKKNANKEKPKLKLENNIFPS